MSKSVAVEAIFLIAVITITLFFIVAIFANWIDVTKFGNLQAGCTAKKFSYCSELINRQKCSDWPSECGTPPDKQTCCVDVLHRSSSDANCRRAQTC